MFTDEEISAAKAIRDALVSGEMPQELKSIYMAGEICMWDELGRPPNPKEPEAVHGNEAEKEVCECSFPKRIMNGAICGLCNKTIAQD